MAAGERPFFLPISFFIDKYFSSAEFDILIQLVTFAEDQISSVRYLVTILLFSISAYINAQEVAKPPLRERLEELGIEYQGFLSLRQNIKVSDDPFYQKHYNLSETRFQIDIDYYRDNSQWKWKSDLVLDPYTEKLRLDIREANAVVTITNWLDIKLGRQILTWGKGDLLFINDLFPKDFQSFFIGRELEYLKAPSDAIKTNLYFKGWQMNFIYSPRFDPDIFPTAERLSFYDPSVGFRGERNPLPFDQPDKWFSEDEYALRIQRNIKGFDIAFYGYHGFWKSPSGYNPAQEQYIFPALSTFGFSVEGAIIGGITSLEMGSYFSEDRDGNDPLINNGQFRTIIGYARDFKKDWKASFQYYQERTTQFEALRASAPQPNLLPNRTQHTITLRVEKMLSQQKWRASIFTFYNISQKDIYLRPTLSYKLTDAWKIDAGANIFAGAEENTFWSQFSHNNNLYFGIKYSY